MSVIIEHFDYLTEQGLKVIPLRVNSKAPMTKCWQKDWSLEKNRQKLQQFPDANIGILLGDVIDVEGDSESANNILADLIGNYPHPSYRSIRSVHHLFKTPDQDLRLLKEKEIEFRGHGHQSVLPPSQHLGIEYQWLTELFPIPEMPPRLLKFYLKLSGHEQSLPAGHIKVWCANCRKECFLHKKRFALELEVFKMLGSPWECQKCRVIDTRPMVRALRSGKK